MPDPNLGDAVRQTLQQSFVSSFHNSELDATLLLLPEVGFISYNDPRFLSTLSRVEKELRHGTHMFRYKYRDDFGHPEVFFCVLAALDPFSLTSSP